MRSVRSVEQESSEDSFLDVVANVVGVLIILVMLVGMQASRGIRSTQPTPAEKQAPPIQNTDYRVAELEEELAQTAEQINESEKSIQEKSTTYAKLHHEARVFDQQRIELATHRSILEQDLERRKQKLDRHQQREFEVQRQLLETKLDLEKLTQEQLSLLAAPEAVTEIECVPTPLAKVVDNQAIHLRIDRGLVSIVPFEQLKTEFETNLEGLRRRLQASGQAFETFGPINGYRLKVTVAKHDAPQLVQGPIVGQSSRPSYSLHAEVLPVSDQLGQNVEQAILPTGRLFRHLQAQRRFNPSIVVWLSTDSFDEYRPLKRFLWEMKFPVAVRPLPPGANIEASPQGTRAAAQ